MKWLHLDQICNHTFCAELLNEKSVVVDLGANQGSFLLGVVKLKNCRCIGVEPNPELAKHLVSYGFEVHNCAISREVGEAVLNIGTNLEASSLGGISNDALARQVTVRTTDFMSWARSIRLDAIDLLKVDIEGEEIHVLESIPDSFLSRVGQLTVEFHDFAGVPIGKIKNTIRRFDKLGFFVVRFSQHTFGDVWFLNSNVLDISSLNKLYLRSVYRNAQGLKRILQRWRDKDPEVS